MNRWNRWTTEAGPVGGPAGGVGGACSLALHGSILTGLVAASWLHVGTIPARELRMPMPPPPIVFDDPAEGGPGSDSPPPPPARAGADPRAGLVEPREISPLPPAPDVEPAPADPDPDASLIAATEVASGDVGDPDGAPDGAPGGRTDGVSGGSGAGGGGTPGGAGDGSVGTPGIGADSPGETIYITGDVTPPRLVTQVRPEYPPAARAARLTGTVLLQIVVDRNGDVEEILVLRTHPLFERAAVEGVRRWKYAPAMMNGRPARVYLLVTVEFKLIS